MLNQLQFLNLLLSSRDMMLVINNGLTVEHFRSFKNEFNFIYNHYKQYGQVPDLATFIKTFPSFEVLDVKESPQYLIDELYKEKNEKFLVDTFNEVRELLKDDKVDRALELFSSASSKAASTKHLEAVNLFNDISRYDEYVDKCNDFQKHYAPTGFAELDAIIGGWDRHEELAVISARSGVGKSWVLLKGADACAQAGLRVGLFSGEMSANKVGYRMDTLRSHISNGMIMHGNRDVSIEYSKYLKSLKENHKGDIFVLTPDRIDGDATVDALRGFIEKYNLDILFIDQHSLLIDHSGARTSFDKAANISKDLKILQTMKHIPIISAVQQNRSTVEEGKFAGTENIAQSDRIAQDATVILFLTVKDGVMTVSIGKSRDGGTGKILNYSVDYNKGTFEYIPSEDEQMAKFGLVKNSEGSFSPMNMPMSMQANIEVDDLPFGN